MSDPERNPNESGNDTVVWVVAGLMALIVVGGLTYGLSYPSLHASNPPPQTTGSGARPL
jgi:hypothetical protein